MILSVRFVDLVTITCCTRPMDPKMGGRKTFSGALSFIFIFFLSDFSLSYRPPQRLCMTRSVMAVTSPRSLERCYPVFRFFLFGIFF